MFLKNEIDYSLVLRGSILHEIKDLFFCDMSIPKKFNVRIKASWEKVNLCKLRMGVLKKQGA